MLRDDTHKSVEMVHATPVKTRDMLISRMLGVWIVTMISLSGLVIGTIAGAVHALGGRRNIQEF